MNGFRYTLILQEPVLANSLGSDPNSARSLLYIPGGLVRGAAIGKYISDKTDIQKRELAAKDDDFRRLFLNGSTRFLNAYPLVNGKRSLPVPFNWQTQRRLDGDEKKVIYNGFDDEIETKGLPFDFWTQKGGTIQKIKEDWQINIHTQRDAAKGRSTSDAGAVYRYIALPAKMKFQGIILIDKKEDKEILQKMLGGTILLGKARTAGYGHAHIFLQELEPGDGKSELPLLEKTTQQFTLSLLSPTLVRDVNGQFSADIREALQTRLDTKLKIIETYKHAEIVGGFNRTWKLPLPQAVAIAAGSVFKIKTDKPISIEVLQKLEDAGLGERRAEGFGCLTYQFDFPDQMEWEEIDPDEDKTTGTTSLPANDPTAQLMLTRLLRRDLDVQIINAARDITVDYPKGKVPNSQLSRWRVILRDAISKKETEPMVERMKKFCSDSQGKPGWDKMSKARVKIGNEVPRLTTWIESIWDNPDSLTVALGENKITSRTLGPNSLNMDGFNMEYRLRLLDAVLARMEKINSQKTSEGGENDRANIPPLHC